MPDAWLGLWVAPGDKAVYIGRSGQAFCTTVTPGVGAAPFPVSDVFGAGDATDRLATRWDGEARLPRFQVEAQASETGRLYLLNVAVENPDPEQWGGYQWRPAGPGDPIATIRLVPDAAGSFMDAVAWLDDEGFIPWAEPWVPYRKGSAEERRLFLAGVGRTDLL